MYKQWRTHVKPGERDGSSNSNILRSFADVELNDLYHESLHSYS